MDSYSFRFVSLERIRCESWIEDGCLMNLNGLIMQYLAHHILNPPPYNTFPGFSIPAGSRAALIRFCTSTDTSPSASSKYAFFSSPIPCSPDSVRPIPAQGRRSLRPSPARSPTGPCRACRRGYSGAGCRPPRARRWTRSSRTAR